MTLGLPHFLLVSGLVLVAGIITMIAKRNAIGILMGVELIVTAAMINFAAFNAYLPPTADWEGSRVEGHVFTLFIMVLAASHAAIAVAVFVNLHQTTGSVDVEDAADEPMGAPVKEPAPGGQHAHV